MGCGSVASSGLFGIVKRSESVVVQAQDRDGKIFKLKTSNLLARVIQHEIDHLNGTVFTDKADPKTYMSRNEYLDKFKK
jgi:peptide deformylase